VVVQLKDISPDSTIRRSVHLNGRISPPPLGAFRAG